MEILMEKLRELQLRLAGAELDSCESLNTREVKASKRKIRKCLRLAVAGELIEILC